MPRNLYATIHGWEDSRSSEALYLVERGSCVCRLPGGDFWCNDNRAASTIRGIFSKFTGNLDGLWATCQQRRCYSACMQPDRYWRCFATAIFSPASPFLTGLPARYTIDALEPAWRAYLEYYHTSHYRCWYCKVDIRGHTGTLRKFCTH